MDFSWAEWVVRAAGVYLGLGILFGILFATVGVGKVDPGARSAPIGFRLLIFPGTVALWPLLARRWLSGGGEPPTESNAHRRAAGS